MTHYIQATHIHAASPFLAVLDEVEALKLIAFVWNDCMLVTMQVSHASGFSLCDDAPAACRRMGCSQFSAPLGMRSASSVNLHSLLQEDPSHTVSHSNYQEDESTLRESHGQHGLGCRSRNFQRGCRLAHAFSFIGQFALIARGRHVTHCLAFELPGGRVYASRIP